MSHEELLALIKQHGLASKVVEVADLNYEIFIGPQSQRILDKLERVNTAKFSKFLKKHIIEITDNESPINQPENTRGIVSTKLEEDLAKFKGFKCNETLKVEFYKIRGNEIATKIK